MIDRRRVLGLLSAAAMTPQNAFSQQGNTVLKRALTSTLEIAYEDSGPEAGFPVLLMHGFPYDPRCYDEVVPPLVAAGHRAIVPYLRGYGPTRFLSGETPRSGQQAARGLVSANGYNIQDIAGSVAPGPPAQEHRLWYQYYFHTERGRAGLQANRREFCKLLWQLWSPNWKFDDATFERSAKSFDNPDFVDVVIQSYRHRFGYAPGDPALEPFEQRLAARPPIPVPSIVLQGEGDGVATATARDAQARFFTGPYRRALIPVIGHDVPQEAPMVVAEAVLELIRTTT
jgi:pimeloyl-ACP methyl ester carboxylesterase